VNGWKCAGRGVGRWLRSLRGLVERRKKGIVVAEGRKGFEVVLDMQKRVISYPV